MICGGNEILIIDDNANVSFSIVGISESSANLKILICMLPLNEPSLILLITYSFESYVIDRGTKTSPLAFGE